MKEYKGLKVSDLRGPSTDKYFMLAIQGVYCEMALECTDCFDCLFHDTNIELFIEWYKEKRRGGMKPLETLIDTSQFRFEQEVKGMTLVELRTLSNVMHALKKIVDHETVMKMDTLKKSSKT